MFVTVDTQFRHSPLELTREKYYTMILSAYTEEIIIKIDFKLHRITNNAISEAHSAP